VVVFLDNSDLECARIPKIGTLVPFPIVFAMAAKIFESLQPKLSPGATITIEPPSRWSLYEAPKPVAIVNVANEVDVATTVSLCVPCPK
jgi:hypothetical protein